ncbi:nitroreductase [Ramlibacter tataouinensis]|uniref:nitroreductase n=1 Tax=Ramlibacter tataouinensis TaxID=94132 RepID=UPI0022F3F283|nr:nitroreductase [Ramlibacter tataouinensis]WBY03072.1 nitroreductase [Ramlibacter tataouinensis]
MTQPAATLGGEAAALESLLAQRHSCRAFRPEPVPRATIERIAALAQRTASWCNAQPWQVFVASGSATERFRAALLAAADAQRPVAPDVAWPREYPGVYGERRRACGFALYESVGVARGDRVASARQARENFRLFGAPHVAIVTTAEPLGPYGALDCGAYVSQFMLAAQSLGVATIAQAALASWPDLVREVLGIAPERQVLCGISFGYADAAHPANGFRTARAALAESLQWRD